MIAHQMMTADTLQRMARVIFDAASREFRRGQTFHAKQALTAATDALFMAGNIQSQSRADAFVAAANSINEAAPLVEALLRLREQPALKLTKAIKTVRS